MAITKETTEEISGTSYFASEEEKKVIDWVYERATNMDNDVRKKMATRWRDAEEQWLAEPGVKNGWQSNIIPPLTTSIVEAELAQVIDYNPEPYLIGRTSEDNNVAKAYSHILDYTKDQGRFKIELFSILKEMLIKGTAIAQEYVWRDVREVKELVKYDPDKGIEEYEEKTIEVFNMPYMESVPLEEIYVDETARSLRGPTGAKDIIRRQLMQLEEFRKVYSGKIMNPLDNAKYVKPGNNGAGLDDDNSYFRMFNEPNGAEGEMVEILHYWGITPHDAYWIVANGVVIRKDPNPYQHKQLPFARAMDIAIPHNFYGKGECDLLKSIQDEVTTLRRMRVDRQHLQIDKMFAVSSRETDLDEEDLIVRPHGIIKLEDPKNSIVPIEYNDIHASAYLEEDRLKEDAIRVTGMDDRMQSSSSSAARTATEAAILKESTLQRLRTKLFLLEAGFLTEVTELRLANINQFMSKPVIRRILGKDKEEFEQNIQRAKEENSYLDIDGDPHKQELPKIPMVNKSLYLDNNEIKEEDKEGVGYFQLSNDILRAHFDVRYESGPQLPISKTLEAQRFTDVYDRLIQNPAYDPMKLGAELLVVNGKDPRDFKAASPEEGGQDPVADIESSIQLAGQENEEMLNGADLPPTPYSTPDHTEIHMAFIESEEFQAASMEVADIFTRHVTGESTAQERRGTPSTGGTLPQAAVPGGAPVDRNLQAAIPGKTQGAENVEVIEPPQRNG